MFVVTLEQTYTELREWAVMRAPRLRVGALSASERQSLSDQFVLDERIRAVLFERYPHAGIPFPRLDGTTYEGSMVFPSLAWLLALGGDDEKWPRDWFPISVTGDHYIQFVVAGTDGVFALYNDTFAVDEPYQRGEQVYASFEAFLRAATATFRYVKPEAFLDVTEGSWPLRRRVRRLRDEVITEIRAHSCNPADGPILLPQCEIELT